MMRPTRFVPDAGSVLVGRGRLSTGRATLIITTVVACVLGVVVGAILGAQDGSQQALEGALVIGVFFTAAGAAASLYALWVWAPAAVVRYYVTGTCIEVTRGPWLVKRVDVSTCTHVTAEGDASTRSFFIGLGTIGSLLSALPQVGCSFARIDRADRTDVLPYVLIIGKDRIAEFRQKLFSELAKNGIDPRILG